MTLVSTRDYTVCTATFGFPNSKKNSFRGNYMRKYGILFINKVRTYVHMQFFSSISGNPVTTATSIRGPNINRPLLAVPKAAGGPNVNLAVMNKVR